MKAIPAGTIAIPLATVTLIAGETDMPPPAPPLAAMPSGMSVFMPVPTENPLTVAKIELGRKLFFDPVLSHDGTVSCASCHQPDKSFTDGRVLPMGVGGQSGRRNALTLINCAYGNSMFWDGRVTSLEKQALLPLPSVVAIRRPHKSAHDEGEELTKTKVMMSACQSFAQRGVPIQLAVSLL